MRAKLTLKQKDRIVQKIYHKYQRAQLDILYLNQHYNYYPQVDVFKVKDTGSYYKADATMLKHLEKKQELESFVSIVNQIQTHLTKSSFFFIENEYLNFYDQHWWLPYFSRASYYREKHKALDEFLEYALSFFSESELMKLLR